MKKNKKAFSIIEIIIAIFIFALGLSSVFLLIDSSLNMNGYNKNQLIASNLARENIELIKNLRDTNYKQEKPWNLINPFATSISSVLENGTSTDGIGDDRFSTGSYYTLENDFSDGTIKAEEITDFGEGISEIKDSGKMQNYRLCLEDSSNHYTYDCTTNKKTNFYRYLKIEDATYNSGGIDKTINDAYKITSKVYWYDKGLHDVEIKTIIADFKRL